MFRPRRAQKGALEYPGGPMGIAAVPGSGKTEILSALAARLVATNLDEGQEVLVVTLVNAAVDNFSRRIRRFLKEQYHLPFSIGYRVRTLHGLSHDIVRERPALVGLSEDFAIADEREALGIRTDAVRARLAMHPEVLHQYLGAELEPYQIRNVETKLWPEHMCDVTGAFISRAKDRGWTPEQLHTWLSQHSQPLPLARLCTEVYADYQRSLAYRGKVDFADLVLLALTALRLDGDYLERLRRRWPFILEDEAQDSSQVQQELLTLLAGDNSNWVRVGDSNQAVYYTFTTANPRLLRDFLTRTDVRAIEMAESGRSALPIIELANHLVDWSVDSHPRPEAREAFRPQHISPTGRKDPQPNPATEHCLVYFHARPLTPQAEISMVVKSLQRWVPEHLDSTVAVLVPDNGRGEQFAKALDEVGLERIELLNSTGPTRLTANILGDLLLHLSEPENPARLGQAFLAWRWRESTEKPRKPHLASIVRLLDKCVHVEEYLWPRLGGKDWLLAQAFRDDQPAQALLSEFRQVARRWHEAAGLPIDQLLMTLSQDLFDEPGDLARAYQFALVLRDYSQANPSYRLSHLAQELRRVARNERRFMGLSAEDTGFEADRYKGKVVVATMHKAKGLEWDRVHLTALNNYDFPSGSELDRYRSEPWYLRDHISTEAEALGQLEALPPEATDYVEGWPSQQARLDYIGERLRLLYVGITRARRELILTWNTGKREEDPKQPALAFTVLRTFWEARQAERCRTPEGAVNTAGLTDTLRSGTEDLPDDVA